MGRRGMPAVARAGAIHGSASALVGWCSPPHRPCHRGLSLHSRLEPQCGARTYGATDGSAHGARLVWGLYVNYAFIALWLADSAWSWWDPSGYLRRSTAARDVLLVIFLFMFVNGAVVFAPWPARALGTFAVIAVVWSRWTRAARRGRYVSAE